LTPSGTFVDFDDATVSVALSKFEVVGVAIVEAKDSILARRKAEVDDIHQPGLPAVVDELNPASISLDLIGCRLTVDDIIINKPPAPCWISLLLATTSLSPTSPASPKQRLC
jgi:hypothetical protein